MEEEETLKLLPGIPRKWLENGNEIEIGMCSAISDLSLFLSDQSLIKAT